MKTRHQISYTAHPDRLEVAQRLREIGLKLTFTGNEGLSEIFVFLITEDDPKWPAVQAVLEAYPPAPHSHHKGSLFDKADFKGAAWINLSGGKALGYPMPDGDFGYLNLTYDLSHYCEECGVGYTQKAPFRLRGEPKWGKWNMGVLFWVYDAHFVRPEVWRDVFQPFGIGCRPALKHRTGETLETVVQLQIDVLLPGPLQLDGYSTEVCPRCHTVKYNKIILGKFPPMTAAPSDVHAAFSQEYFGTGGEAFRELFVSQALYQAMERYKVTIGPHNMPVADNPEAAHLPVIPWAPMVEPPREPRGSRCRPGAREASPRREEAAQEEGTRLRNARDEAEMVLIPPGDFLMGTSEEEVSAYLEADATRTREGFADELPQRQVYLDAYYMYKYPVTVAQYRRFVEATGFDYHWKNMEPSYGWVDEYPMTVVNWWDAATYAEWAGAELPTEAQWEKAARGTDGRQYPWGDTWDPEKCNNWATGPRCPTPVGSYPDGVSPYGVHDLAGNVWEWCADWYDRMYYRYAPTRNPTGPTTGINCVARGGAWNFYFILPPVFRTANRFVLHPTSLSNIYGFRCVVRAVETSDGAYLPFPHALEEGQPRPRYKRRYLLKDFLKKT